MSQYSFRTLQRCLLFFSIFVIGFTFYIQYIQGLQPCPLCLMQRFSAFLFTLCCLLALCVSSLKKNKVITMLQMFFAFAGILFAARQLWIQNFPHPEAKACLPDLAIMMKYFPWQDILHSLFWGAGACAEVKWKWLGLSMPAWALIYFFIALFTSGVIFSVLGKYGVKNSKRR